MREAKNEADGEHEPGQKAKIKRLLNSPLALKLLLFFAVLPIVEAFFIGVLCFDINNAVEAAGREFMAVKASQELSGALESIRAVNLVVRDHNANPQDPGCLQRFPTLRAAFIERTGLALADLQQLCKLTKGPDSARQINDLSQAISRLDATYLASMSAPLAEEPDRYKEYRRELKRSFFIFEDCMEKAQSAVKLLAIKPPLLGIEPVALLYTAAFVNLVFVAVLALFIELRLTRPVSRLTTKCQKIKNGEAIEKPPQARDEIGSLHESFYQMSLKIAEDQKRRQSYLELLQSVQASALARVNSWLEKIQNNNSCDPQSRRRVEKSRGSISTLIEILKSMTDVLAGRTGESIVLQCRPCRSSDLCGEAAAAVESLLEKRELKLKIEAEDLELDCDPVLIDRVLINLLSNAAKYSPERGAIILGLARQGRQICFSVQDSGPGIAASQKTKLFKKFSQLTAADGVKRAGTGLGLLICKEIVAAHGGEIGCDSEPEKGSKFWFKLPLDTSGKQTQTEQKAKRNLPLSLRIAGSIKLQFSAMLIFFICVQAFLFWDLHSAFRQYAESAGIMAEQRSQILGTQSMFAHLLVCGRVAKAGNLVKAENLFGKQVKQARLLCDREKKGSVTYDEFSRICRRLQTLQRTISYGMAHPEEMLLQTSKLRSDSEKLMDEVEDSIYRILAIQKSGYQATYQGARDIQERILTLLAVAAATDLIVILAAAGAALSIVERINALKAKSEEFAGGRQISPSLKGRDELSFLDQSLCQASSAIHEGEAQRQELIAVINHDLRTPLASVLANLELISQGVFGRLPDEPAEVLEMSEFELQHLLAQINDLLMLEKIDSGTYQLARDKLRLTDILEESLRSIKESSARRNVEVALDASAALDDAVLDGDRQLLVRLCTIVLANAVSASAPQSEIKMSLRRAHDRIVAEIEDSGPGIGPELQAQIFDRFRFVAGKPLTGLGLPLAYRLCKMHGGSIDLKSAPQEGTTIAITLPLLV
jgi:signal transduction histidine kinase